MYGDGLTFMFYSTLVATHGRGTGGTVCSSLKKGVSLNPSLIKDKDNGYSRNKHRRI